MTAKTLIKLLTILNEITVYDWKIVCAVHTYINNGKEHVDCIKKEWYDEFKQKNPDFYPLDLSKIETWSTFEHCAGLTFSIESGRIKCVANVYDGANFTGQRKGLRFTTELLLPTSFIHTLSYYIEFHFEQYLNERYDEYLEAQKRNWINNLKSEILEKE